MPYNTSQTFGSLGYGADLPEGEGLYSEADRPKTARNAQIAETQQLVNRTMAGAADVGGASAQQLAATQALGGMVTDFGQTGQAQREQAVQAALGQQATQGAAYSGGARMRSANPFMTAQILGAAGGAGIEAGAERQAAAERATLQGAEQLQQANLQQQAIAMDVRQAVLEDAAKRQAMLERQAAAEQQMREEKAAMILGATTSAIGSAFGYGMGLPKK